MVSGLIRRYLCQSAYLEENVSTKGECITRGVLLRSTENFSGLLRVLQFSLCLDHNTEVQSHQTSQSSLVFFTFKTGLKISFSEKANCSLTINFTGAKDLGTSVSSNRHQALTLSILTICGLGFSINPQFRGEVTEIL